MQRTASPEFTFCLAVLLLSLTVLKSEVVASPGIIHVPLDFPTIQGAINAANSGDYILVSSGLYLETIVVNKTLSIVGENRESTIVDGMGTGTAVNVTANNVILEEFTLRNAPFVLYLRYSSGCTIVNNIISESTSDSGIILDHSNNNMIANNIAKDNQEVGLYLYYSSGNTISQNNSTGNLVGLWLLFSNGNTLIGNNAANNSYGLWLEFSGSNTLRGNLMTNNAYNFGVHSTSLTNFIQDIDSSNRVEGKPIYYLVNQQNQQIPSDAGYVAAVNSTNVTVKDLNLKNNREGVLFAYTNSSKIEGNVVSNSSESAIYLYKSSANTITGNSVNTTRDGVSLYESDGNIASKNTVAQCVEYGVWLVSSSGNTISNNAIIDNWVGAMLFFSGGNTIESNNLTLNQHGIWLSSSSNNNIHHNNLNNTGQVRINGGSISLWDDGYPSGGNYWSNYVGSDFYWGPYQNKTGSDGIGDTPFVIDGNNRDQYPLISPHEYWSNPIPGDINKDTKVDSIDLSQLATAYGSAPEKPNWNPNCDINSDNIVSVSDLFDLGKNFGKP